MPSQERRSSRRFRMKLPLALSWGNGAGHEELQVETEIVSSRGVQFYTHKSVKAGAAVEFQMTLPHEITLAGPVRVRCLGRVVRTDHREAERVGVVVAIERYEFVRGDRNAA